MDEHENAPSDHGELAPNPRPHPGPTGPASVPTAEDCLRALAQLPGLTAMKLISTGQCNSIKSIYATILAEYRHSERSTGPQVQDELLLKFLKKDPGLLNLIAPLLTPGQLEFVMKWAMHDEQREA